MNQESREPNLYRIPLLLMGFYIVCMTPLMGRKNGYTVDATPSFELTRTIVETGEWFPDSLKVKQGYLYSVVSIPFYVMSKGVATLLPYADPAWLQRKSLCWMNTVITGCTLGLLSLLLFRLGFSRRTQVWLPVMYGFSTLAFNYARYDYNKCLAGFLLLLSFYFIIRFLQEEKARFSLSSGLAMGLLLALRLEMVVLAVVFVVFLTMALRNRPRRWSYSFGFLLPVILGILWVVFYNHLYWNTGLSGGYEGGFHGNPFSAIMGFLFSPGKNIWFFNPILLLLPLSFRLFYTHQKQVSLLWLGTICSFIMVYSCWWNWWGGWGWGARHLVPLIPLMILPLASLMDGQSKTVRRLLIGLFGAGVLVQFLGAVIDFNDVILTLTRHHVSEQSLIWNPMWNAIFQHALFFLYLPVSRWDIGWCGLLPYVSFSSLVGMMLVWFGILGGIGFALFKAEYE